MPAVNGHDAQPRAAGTGATGKPEVISTDWSYPRDLKPRRRCTLEQLIPPLPQPFALEQEVQDAKAALFTPEFLGADCPVAILAGPQASGKSTVASALVQDAQIKLHFQGGIVWIRCDKCTGADSVLRQILVTIRGLNEHSSSFPVPFLTDIMHSAASLTEEIAVRLACRRVLLVLDDVRDAAVVRSCNVLGVHLLVTTCATSVGRRLKTSAASNVVVYEMRALSPVSTRILLFSKHDFQGVPPSEMEELCCVLGRLPQELVLVSYVFHLVASTAMCSGVDMVRAVVRRLQTSHQAIQEHIRNDQGVQNLSHSHMCCWRSLAVALELLPATYRRCMLQLVSVPVGAVITQELLLELWGVGVSELAPIVTALRSMTVLSALQTTTGRCYSVSSLALDYMVYWARMHKRGVDVGRLQRWLLMHPQSAARVCQPFLENGHRYITRWAAPGAGLNLNLHAPQVCEDPLNEPLLTACTNALQTARGRGGGFYLLSLVAAAVDSRLLALAVRLLNAATAELQASMDAPAFGMLSVQLDYTMAQLELAQGRTAVALGLMERLLARLETSSVHAPRVRLQVLTAVLAATYAARNGTMVLSLAAVRCGLAQRLEGPGLRYISCLLDQAHAQLFMKEKPHAVKQTIKLARQSLDRLPKTFSLLHLNLERTVIAYYLYIGRIPDVETKMCRLYMQTQRLFDPSHDVSTALMNDIALCLNVQGNFSDAHDMLLETLSLFEKPARSLQAQHLCALAHNNLAVSMVAMGRPLVANAHMREALTVLSAITHPFIGTAPTMYLRAVIFLQFGEHTKAKQLLLELVAQHKQEDSGCCASTTAAALETLAALCIMQGDFPHAIASLGRCLQMTERMEAAAAGGVSAAVAAAKPLFLLSLAHERLGEHAKAKECHERYEALVEKHPDHPFLLWMSNIESFQELVPVNLGSDDGSAGAVSSGEHSTDAPAATAAADPAPSTPAPQKAAPNGAEQPSG